MSGGVDSSVSACLLAEQGYEVVGSHMHLVHLDGVEHGCCGPSAERDARAVAEIGGFPFAVVDLSATFAETVLADFFGEHGAGRTPNPCARCNEQIKFGAFLDRASDLGVDFVATGHYVRRERGPDGRWRLLRGADHAAFLAEREPSLVRAGEVVDPEGRVLAAHDGAFRFTIGQRRGLGVTTGRRAYVVDEETGANRVVVGPAELLSRRGLEADRVTWVAGEPPAGGPFEAEVQIRYRSEAVQAVIETAPGGRVRVEFRSPVRAVAPGQSVAFYRGDELLGGGRIVGATR